MIIIPAVDIRGGKAVRLVEGREDLETVFGDDRKVSRIGWCFRLDGVPPVAYYPRAILLWCRPCRWCPARAFSPLPP